MILGVSNKQWQIIFYKTKTMAYAMKVNSYELPAFVLEPSGQPVSETVLACHPVL